MLTGTLHERILAAGRTQPAAPAVACNGAWLDYAGLVAAAEAIAGGLQARGVEPGHRIGVLVERGRDLVPALLGVLLAGAAFIPIEPGTPTARRAVMLADAGAHGLLADRANAPAAAGSAPLLLEDLPRSPLRPVCVEPAALAYVLFTSGSTGRPKGVCVRHEAVVFVLDALAERLEVGAEARLLAVSSVAFDMSILDFFLPLSRGGSVVLAPRDAAANGGALCAALERDAITLLQATPTTLRLIAGSGALAGRKVLSAGERLTGSLAASLLGAGAILYNGYGLTESTIAASCGRVCGADEPIGAGPPLRGVDMWVLDPDLRPTREEGELYVGGPGVSPGYAGRPDEDVGRFVDNPFGPGRLLRTGDRGRWAGDGSVLVAGRADRQIKLRGMRVEPGEVEAALLAEAGVSAAAVDVRGEARGPALVAWVVCDRELDIAVLRRNLGARLPGWAVPTRIARVAALPQTGAGKLDLGALETPAPERGDAPASLLAHRPPFSAPLGAVEQGIAALFEELLRVPAVGREDDFVALGGDSLLAAELAAQASAAFAKPLGMSDVLRARTPRAIAEAAGAPRRRVERAPIRGRHPPSAGQLSAWIASRMNPTSALAVVRGRLRLRGLLDEPRLWWALREVVLRHDALRSRVIVADGKPTVVVSPTPLDPGGPVRAELVHLGLNEAELRLVLDHGVCDGASFAIVAEELAALYGGASLPEVAWQAADFAAWEQGGPSPDPALIQALLASPLRPPLRSSVGEPARRIEIDGLTGDVRALARAHGVTPFTAAVACLATTVAVETGERRVVIGAALASREAPELGRVVGMLTNTVAIPMDLTGCADLSAAFRVAAAAVDRAFAQRELPLTRVIAALPDRRRPDQQGLFRVLLLFGDEPDRFWGAGGLDIALQWDEEVDVPYDVTLEVRSGREKALLHGGEGVGQADSASFVGTMRAVLAGACGPGDRAPSDMPLLHALRGLRGVEDAEVLRVPRPDGAVDRVAVLVAPPHAATVLAAHALGPDRCVAVRRLPLDSSGKLSISEVPGLRAPAGPSVLEGPPLPPWPRESLVDVLARAQTSGQGLRFVKEDGTGFGPILAYARLMDLARRGAAHVRSLTHGSSEAVLVAAIHPMQRIVAMWSVLLAGSPAALSTPAVARAAGLPLALTLVGPGEPDGVQLDLGLEPIDPPHLDADAAAIVLFTTGSSGTPKAIVHTHATALAAVRNLVEFQGQGRDDVMLNWLGLDHVAPLFMTHLAGVLAGCAQVHAPPRTYLTAPRRALDWIAEARATYLAVPNFVIGQLADAVGEGPVPDVSSIRTIANAGEPISPRTVDRLLGALAPGGLRPRVMAPCWGMTETGSVCITQMDGMAAGHPEPVECGRPMAGWSLKVVGPDGEPVPQGELGRLLVRGPSLFARLGVARAGVVRSADGFYDTGDEARIERGLLYVLGRLDNVVMVHGVNVSAALAEGVVADATGIERSSVVVVDVLDPRGDVVLCVCLEGEDDPGREARAREALAAQLGLSARHVLAFPPGGLPRSPFGKLLRGELRRALVAQLDASGGEEVAAGLSRSWRRRPAQPGAGGGELRWFERPTPGEVLDLLRKDGLAPLILAHPERVEHGWIAGLVRTARAERGGGVRAVSLEEGLGLHERQRILALEEGCPHDEVEVAWRGGQRWVARLSTRPIGAAPPLEIGGAVVITGGGGGVGLQLARRLLDRSAGALLLLGRRPAPALPPEATAVLGDRARYASVDVTDAVALSAALRGFAAEFGPISGAFHLAADPTAQLVRSMDAGALAHGIARTNALYTLSAALPADAWLVSVGTALEVTGGLGLGGYAAESAHRAAVCAALRLHRPATWHIAYSAWRDTGLSRTLGGTELAERRGFTVLAPADALDGMDRAIASGPSNLVIGLDPRHDAVRRALECGPVGVEAVRLRPAVSVAPPTRAPSGSAEGTLTEIWAEVLGLSSPRVDANFFDLGGDSAQLAHIHVLLEARLGRRVPLAWLFQHSTIRALAAALDAPASLPTGGAAEERARRARAALSDLRRRPSS